jgi:hypothetical protein
MSQTSIERLKEYLAQLPPQAQALLMREFERAIERGENVAVATFVLTQLRKVARGSNKDEPPRTDDPARLLFRPLDPFLVESTSSVRPGQIQRASLLPVWQWLLRDGAPDEARQFEAALARSWKSASAAGLEGPTRKLQLAAVQAIDKIVAIESEDIRHRAFARVGRDQVTADLLPIGAVLQAHEALDTLNERLPRHLPVFGDSQIVSVANLIDVPALQTPQVLPFALSLVMQRLSASWQIIRLAIKTAGSDEEIRVAATPYGVAVTMAIQDLASVATVLRADIKRGRLERSPDHLKILHDGVRGLRTELDIRNDSAWGRQLAAIRVDISSTLQSEIDSVPGRVRRLLRQRADKDISAGTRVDADDVEETAALIDFVAICRNYASELAINEVTLRAYSDLQHYVEQSTKTLVHALRGGDPKTRMFRQTQVQAAIRFCDVLFGGDYASLMNRAADNALTDDQKAIRTG